MKKYNVFLFLFILSVAAFIVFMIFYLQGFFTLIFDRENLMNHPDTDPTKILRIIFSPTVIISFILMAVSSLAAKILGIVCVAKSKTVNDGEKAMWIVGFVMMGFITGIVFLIMAKGKKFVE